MLKLIHIVLIIRPGIFKSTYAYEAAKRGNHVKVIKKRDHIGGNIYTKKIDGIDIHMYGAHIFHTKMKDIWDYINQFATFNNFVNSPVANYHGHLYNTLVKGYTEKQWGRSAKNLPAFIIVDYLSILLVIITLMILIKEFRLAGILKLSRRC